MILPSKRNKNAMQLCWLVPDLEEAIANWVQTAGAGPFFIFEELHFDDSLYRGEAKDIQPCRAAIGQFGDTQIELVQPTSDEAGIWSEIGVGKNPVFHHVGFYCEDYEAEREAYLAAGSQMAFEGLMMGAKTCYIDTLSSLGYFTELITANPIAEQVFGAFKTASEGWDGSDPIRTMG